jgi:hypothetical protein
MSTFCSISARPLDALKVADLSRSLTFQQNPQPAGDSVSKNSPQLAFRPQDTARSLNATLLFYWLGERRSWLWVVTPAQTSLVALPPSAEIEAPVKSYRQAFLVPAIPSKLAMQKEKSVYQTLVGPAETFIPKNSRVVIFPRRQSALS